MSPAQRTGAAMVLVRTRRCAGSSSASELFVAVPPRTGPAGVAPRLSRGAAHHRLWGRRWSVCVGGPAGAPHAVTPAVGDQSHAPRARQRERRYGQQRQQRTHGVLHSQPVIVPAPGPLHDGPSGPACDPPSGASDPMRPPRRRARRVGAARLHAGGAVSLDPARVRRRSQETRFTRRLSWDRRQCRHEQHPPRRLQRGTGLPACHARRRPW